ncbi:MAG: response regulator transcription factor [Verrucomicrobia bacterium]|nr:response regulator transcription factor [Verrucomicrobiota bacterium]
MDPVEHDTGRIRLLIADDHTILRQGLAAVLAEEPDFDFVGFAEDGQQALERYAALKPDVVLLDLRMPKRDGLEVARELMSRWQAKVLILTAFDDDEDLRQGLKAGAKGYLLKDAAREEIADAVRTVAQGGTYLPARLAGRLASIMFRTELTERERAVLRLMCEGKSNKEIGARLFISEGTVKTHVKNLFSKLDVNSRSEAVAAAIRRGLARG